MMMMMMIVIVNFDDLQPRSAVWKLNAVNHLDPRWYRPMLLNNVPSIASQRLIFQTHVHVFFMKYRVFHHCINLRATFYMDGYGCM